MKYYKIDDIYITKDTKISEYRWLSWLSLGNIVTYDSQVAIFSFMLDHHFRVIRFNGKVN